MRGQMIVRVNGETNTFICFRAHVFKVILPQVRYKLNRGDDASFGFEPVDEFGERVEA
jgi:hypothetical protein